MATVSIGIVTYNNEDKIENLLESLYQFTKGVSFSVYVVDNASSDRTLDIVRKKYPQVVIMPMDKNLGFGAGHNQLLNVIDSEYHLILNPDIRFEQDTISELVQYLQNNPNVAMVTPKIMNEDGTEQHLPKKVPKMRYLLAGRLSPYSRFFSHLRDEYTLKNQKLDTQMEIDFSTGCFMLVRSYVFKKVGGFDERFFMYLEDADLSLRVKKYGKVIFYPHTRVIHAWERSSAKKIKYFLIHMDSMRKFASKWKMGGWKGKRVL